MNEHYQTLILGGGLSGLTVAHKLRTSNPKHDYLVIDGAARTGGVIKSHHEEGYITEIGPHGFLDNCEESRQILAETGLELECIKAPLSRFVRYVYVNGRLNLIPQTPAKIFMAPLIPWHAKLRVAAELWKPPLGGEPTVAKWASHRFGPALLPYIDAVYTGTYAGDFDKLTIDSVMPGVRALEKEHGSVLRGLIARMRSAGKGQKGDGKFRMPSMTSFPGGMQRLAEKLSEPLVEGNNLLLNATATAVAPCSRGWQVTTSEGRFTATNLVISLPINKSLKLLAPLDPAIPEKSVPETWIATVALGFTDDTMIPPGFGFLTPEQEQRFSLGCLFTANMFPGRAPSGHLVIETLVGGRRHPERLTLDDTLLAEKALADVRDILQIKKAPVYTRVLRSDGGIPQLERNYPRLLQWQKSVIRNNPGLHICGFGWGGIGLNDMMKSGSRVAKEILLERTAEHGADVKAVYF